MSTSELVAACEIMLRANDIEIIKFSHSENRVLLTEDKGCQPYRFGRSGLDTISGKCALDSTQYRSLACRKTRFGTAKRLRRD
jgi:hypothetical protein